MTNHRLQRGVLVVQRPLGHHLLLIVIDRQPLRHLLYVLPQRGDGLPDEQQDYQPDERRRIMMVNICVITITVSLININWTAGKIPQVLREVSVELV